MRFPCEVKRQNKQKAIMSVIFTSLERVVKPMFQAWTLVIIKQTLCFEQLGSSSVFLPGVSLTAMV